MERRYGLIGAFAIGFALASGPASAQGRLVTHSFDRGAGALVRVFTIDGGGRIEVETPSLKLTKTVAGSTVTTSISGDGDELVVTYDRRTLSVSTPAGKVSARQTQTDRLERARDLIARSRVGQRAAVLIGKLSFGSDTPVRPMLVTTRAFLLAATRPGPLPRGDERTVEQPKQERLGAPAVIRAAYQKESSGDRTPTECWEAYSKEAIAAYIDYEECMKDLSWWQVLEAIGCATVYDMRAIGAFSWWMRCVSIG